LPGRTVEADRAAHRLDQALRYREPEAGAAELPAGAAFGLLEFLEDAGLQFRRDADAGVVDAKRQGAIRRPLDRDRDAAGFGKLDRIADEIEQNLAQAGGIADETVRGCIFDECGDFDAFGMGVRRQQLDHVLDQRAQRKRLDVEVEPARLDLGKIEDVLDQPGQRLARRFHRFGIGRLLRRERRIQQEIGHAENAVERRADLVGHHGEKAPSRPSRGIGLPPFPFPVGKGFDALFEQVDATTASPIDPVEGEAQGRHDHRQRAEAEIKCVTIHCSIPPPAAAKGAPSWPMWRNVLANPCIRGPRPGRLCRNG
jgi:hypothetical protein